VVTAGFSLCLSSPLARTQKTQNRHTQKPHTLSLSQLVQLNTIYGICPIPHANSRTLTLKKNQNFPLHIFVSVTCSTFHSEWRHVGSEPSFPSHFTPLFISCSYLCYKPGTLKSPAFWVPNKYISQILCFLGEMDDGNLKEEVLSEDDNDSVVPLQLYLKIFIWEFDVY
jgi:hypothetical protein